MKKKKIEKIKITISLTHDLYKALVTVRASRGISQSEIIRNALHEADWEELTEENANHIGGGYFRTVANITSIESDMLQECVLITELNKSAVIRAALFNYLSEFGNWN